MTIDWKNAPDWAKAAIMNDTGNWHWIANADAYSSSLGWHEIGRSQRIKDFASLDGKKWRDSKVLRPTSTAIPELKKLTQAVFDGLPVEYQWAAVDEDGCVFGYENKPDCGHFTWIGRIGNPVDISSGYDTTDWQNSLIEREEVTVPDVMQSIANKLIGGWAERQEKREESGQTPEAELAALRTQAVADAAEIERLKVGHDRYEILRTLNPRQFADLYAENLETGVAFDDLVDELARGDL